ncbi:MAG: DNA primase [Crenarchaeota archaeon]|nr:DNA primase [Thermoproteota archaeon]
MRYATLAERKEFYTKEFKIGSLANWFGDKMDRTKFALIMGKHTNIFLDKYKKDISTTIIIDQYNGLTDIRKQIIDFLPEAVYYDRNRYDETGQKIGQELAFDLDPENINCPIHGTLEDKIKRGQGLSFCKIELEMVRKKTNKLYKYLEGTFSAMRIVYSGRGFHLHVLDECSYGLNTKQRLKLAREVKHAGFPIDEWVTSGEHRLIRLPYSLNGLVSRIVLPLEKREIERFNAIYDHRCIPKFLDKSSFNGRSV